tara:strand:+ start:770 stop:1021 length:252 start_codon:yes stop_codon:yes gene_type:complete
MGATRDSRRTPEAKARRDARRSAKYGNRKFRKLSEEERVERDEYRRKATVGDMIKINTKWVPKTWVRGAGYDDTVFFEKKKPE